MVAIFPPLRPIEDRVFLSRVTFREIFKNIETVFPSSLSISLPAGRSNWKLEGGTGSASVK